MKKFEVIIKEAKTPEEYRNMDFNYLQGKAVIRRNIYTGTHDKAIIVDVDYDIGITVDVRKNGKSTKEHTLCIPGPTSPLFYEKGYKCTESQYNVMFAYFLEQARCGEISYNVYDSIRLNGYPAENYDNWGFNGISCSFSV